MYTLNTPNTSYPGRAFDNAAVSQSFIGRQLYSPCKQQIFRTKVKGQCTLVTAVLFSDARVRCSFWLHPLTTASTSRIFL